MSEMGYAVESDQRQMAIPNKKPKLGFVKRWLLKSVKDAHDAERNSGGNYVSTPDIISSRHAKLSIGGPSIDQPERAIQFTVYVANGGRVVETRRVDRKTDRSTTGLYIITSEQDFGKEIDKIITMEALR